MFDRGVYQCAHLSFLERWPALQYVAVWLKTEKSTEGGCPRMVWSLGQEVEFIANGEIFPGDASNGTAQ